MLRESVADISLLTETWFNDDAKIKNELEDFTNKTGYGFIRKDRTTGRRGGGIAICFDSTRIQMSRSKIPPSKHEVLAAIGRRTGQRRKIAVVVAYVPPWYNSQENKSFYSYINDVILALKTKYENPIILIGADFNRRDMREATRDYPEMAPILTGPTRDQATLDAFVSNINHTIIDQGTLDPLYSETGIQSDHRAVFCSFRMSRVPSYNIEKYSYFHVDQEGISKFGGWLDTQSWSSVTEKPDASSMVVELHRL